ncbi:MAG TPA: hypothetical protein VE591_13310 [Candidatus Acidoferrum sp.]|jgi:hypothetical protein|nr:hypothetical protein [Candidatus Acidoferrum sp.]
MTQSGSADTGTRDKDYDLVSVVYHALEGASTYGRYQEDARRERDEQAERFFQQAIERERATANEGKRLLKERL